jgi:predicted Abi (CAAX) family protease
MNTIQLHLARTDPVEPAGASAAARGLKNALMTLVVALAALASAIVLVLNPQPIPYPAQAPLACSGTETHASPEVAKVQHMSRVSRRTDDAPDARCA